jgi:outer membrane protein insertion porin family
MVYNEAAYDLLIVPKQVKAFDTAEFCSLLDIPIEEVRQNIKKARSYSMFKPSIFLEQLSKEDFGYLDELRLGTPINPFEKFFMGGNGLVIATVPLRGYDDRSIGPKVLNTTDARGGNVMVKFTYELRFAIALEPIPLYMILFAEAGNVYESFETADLFDLRRSVGVGARIMINPIGLIGFDLGYGFDRKLVNGLNPEWLFHFQFGKGF